MNSQIRVTGIIHTRNEWPLLAIAICHALLSGVHDIYVVDNGSTDGSLGGVALLQTLWPERIHVIALQEKAYLQELTVNALITLLRGTTADWFYIFDADEFLLFESSGLDALLKQVRADIPAISYPVINWISTTPFDDHSIDDYNALTYRAVANIFVSTDPVLHDDEIDAGFISFFDLPFPSKMLVRNKENTYLSAGAHRLKYPCSLSILDLSRFPVIQAAHLPLLSRRRLDLRVEHGRRLTEAGFGVGHGWQNQMLQRIGREGRLDKFWRDHSICSGATSTTTQPQYISDDKLVKTLSPTLSLLSSIWNEVIAVFDKPILANYAAITSGQSLSTFIDQLVKASHDSQKLARE